ncbi:GumC family protein [Sedimentisphaera salicampi]|uniref:non-specific protein-tyrosine kinase n=1 Tax=Sedimentisphaera salicampi TaxID=1941349 RepID=A0A1W6LQ97_9BACT|nr:polysaccharide biosynthesis tyrosine autokinase [Sedimentisphaera salicampi]ARN57944.1 Tyrosine-protein kinase YwqD [Sedimentisphaera salicampi]OXU14112.1 Tyrosine-protein kinase YwqD [Sedimentisphaera salicampi]
MVNESEITSRLPMQEPQAEGIQLTPKDILTIIRRHLLLIILLPILGAALGVGLYFVFAKYSPKYTSTSAIRVLEPEISDPMKLAARMSNTDTYYQFRQTKARFIKQQDMLQNLLETDQVRNTQWFRQFVADDGRPDIADALEALEDSIGVNVARDNFIIQISFSSKNARESKLILDQLVELYTKSQLERETQTQRDKLAQAKEEERKVRAEIRAAEASLRDIRQSNPTLAEFSDTGDTGSQRHSIKVKHDSLEVQVMDLEGQISEIESRIATLESRAQGEFDEVVREQMENDPIAISARQRILYLRPELARLTAKLGENHRSVRKMREQLRMAESELNSRQNFIAELNRQSQLQQAEDQRAFLVSQLENYRAQLQDALLKQKELDELRAEYESFVEIRERGRERLEKLIDHIQSLNMLVRDPKVSKLEPLGEAILPLQKSFPDLKLFVPAGIVLGGFIAVVFAFIRELANDKLRTPQDVSKAVDIPVLGVIYNSKEDDDVEDIQPERVVNEAPNSVTGEAYRQLKSNVKLSGALGYGQVLMITSANPQEGKSTVASNLSVSLAAEQNKVLLIDANFRRPAFSIYTSQSGESEENQMISGLSEVLAGDKSTEDVIVSGQVANLDIMACGELPEMPSEMLSGRSMHKFLTDVKGKYDFVVIDAPPVIMSEAKSLSAMADSTLVVFNAQMTKRGVAQRTVRELDVVNANVIGCSLVSAKALKGGYFNQYLKTYKDYIESMPETKAS